MGLWRELHAPVAAVIVLSACGHGSGPLPVASAPPAPNASANSDASANLDAAPSASLEPACEKGGAAACYELAQRLVHDSQGEHVALVRAADLYARSCRAGLEKGCANLGAMYEEGWGVERDLPKAVELYRSSCEHGDPGGCEDLGFLFEQGKGVAQSYEASLRAYKAACDHGDYYCSPLGLLYEWGHGAPADYPAARSLHQRACASKRPEGCVNLAFMEFKGMGAASDPAKAEAAATAGCDLHFGAACIQRALLRAFRALPAAHASDARLQAACALEDPAGCFRWALVASLTAEDRQTSGDAARTLAHLCEAANAEACHLSGVFAYFGRARRIDPVAAKTYWQRACSLGSSESCALVE